MSNRRERSTRPARRAIRISRPSQTASNSARVIIAGRGDSGPWTSALSSPTLPSSRNPPSRNRTIPGNGELTSRSQVVGRDRALSPNSLAQRSISGMPIGPAPKRWQICSGSALRPWKRNSATKLKRPGSAGSTSVPVTLTPPRYSVFLPELRFVSSPHVRWTRNHVVSFNGVQKACRCRRRRR